MGVKARTLWSIAASGRAPALRGAVAAAQGIYTASFLVGAARAGVIARLGARAHTADELARALGIGPEERVGFGEWLHVGTELGQLRRRGERYALRTALARALAEPSGDDLLALLEESVELHRRLLVETPTRMKEGRLFSLDDQDGEVIGRSSRIAEPLVQQAVRGVIPKKGRVRLLEIGCGSGTYVRFAASLNPELTAVGLELQANVAHMATENLRSWGLGARVSVEAADIRERTPRAEFDVATLHNNIYYFPVAERIDVLTHVRGFLVPGGKLLVTTGCTGGSLAMSVLSLWGAATRGAAPLPDPKTLCDDMRAAGFVSVTAESLAAPFDSFWAFVAARK